MSGFAKIETTGWLRVKLAKAGQMAEDWFTLVDDDGMPFYLRADLYPRAGLLVRLTIDVLDDPRVCPHPKVTE